MFISIETHSEVDHRLSISAIETKNGFRMPSINIKDSDFFYDNEDYIKEMYEDLQQGLNSDKVITLLVDLTKVNVKPTTELINELKEMLMFCKLMGMFNK